MNQQDDKSAADLFKEYGAGVGSVTEAIEKFAVDLMTIMCNAPKRIVLDKHTYEKYRQELLAGTKYIKDEEREKLVDQAIKMRATSSGIIEIVCEG